LYEGTEYDADCRGKFVAPGKFFPPPYSHNVTHPNPNPNPNFNAIPNLNHNPYCCIWELFSGATNFPLHRTDSISGSLVSQGNDRTMLPRLNPPYFTCECIV